MTADFTGSIDGEEFEGGKASDFVLAMGQGRMIPGFEEGLVGHKAGEEFSIDVNFPEDYHAENLKGKAAKFAIVLKKVEERELPELTEEFIKRFGVADGSVAGLRTEVRKNMERELKGAVRNRIKSQAIDGLVSANEIDVPAALIDGENRRTASSGCTAFRRQREASAGTATRAVRRASETPRSGWPAAGRSDQHQRFES